MDNFKQWLMSEMPIQLNKTGGWGDTDKKYGYQKDDIGILNNERGINKITLKWSKVKQNFNTWACRSSKCFQQIEVGEVDEDFVRDQLGLKIVPNPTQPDEIKIDPSSINYIVTNNRGAERMPLNAWTLAHRFGHAIGAGGRRRVENVEWNYFLKELWGDVRRIAEGVYNYKLQFSGGFPMGANNNAITKQLCMALGTMKSARSKTLREFFEFPYELVAQHIIEQRIRFNPLAKSLSYWKKPEERNYGSGPPERGYRTSLFSRDEYDRESWNEYIQEGFAETVNEHIERVLNSCVGKIYVM
jgi:hypothetical protein